MEGGMMKPAWMDGLMAETFFGGCGVHRHRRKNEKNIFCLLCCQSFCPHCLPSHQSHPFLQVRRYVYQNVIRLDDLEKLIDCAYIQPYTINSAKVIFLNQRTQSRSCNNKTFANSCFTCDRILQDPFSFCSLSCKVDFMAYHDQDLSDIILFKFDESGVPVSPFEEMRMDGSDSLDDDGKITLHSSLEDPLECKNTACSSSTMGNSGISQNVEKERTKNGSRYLPSFMVSVSNRRKGAPSRSPFS